MSRIRPILLVSVLGGLLFGCSNDDGLSARGSVVSETRGTFEFTQDTRLDGPPEGLDGVFTGSCEMAAVAPAEGDAEHYGVVMTIRRGNDVDDLGLAEVTIMQRTDADPGAGRVEAVFGMTDFTSDAAGPCTIEIPYAERDAGIVGLTGECTLADADGNEETVTIALDVTGCEVID